MFVKVDLVILLLVNRWVSLFILFCFVRVSIWVFVFLLLVNLVMKSWLCVCVVIWGKCVIYMIWWVFFKCFNKLFIIDVVGLLILVFILLKIIVGVVWLLFVIIWIVKLMCDSLFFEIIFFNLFVFWLGLVDMLNCIVLRL